MTGLAVSMLQVLIRMLHVLHIGMGKNVCGEQSIVGLKGRFSFVLESGIRRGQIGQ